MMTSDPHSSSARKKAREGPQFDPAGEGPGTEAHFLLDLAGRHPSSFTERWILGHRRTGRFTARRGRSPIRAIV